MTIKQLAISKLQIWDAWQWGGDLEKEVSEIKKCKTSNVGRRLRELENAGIIKRRLERIGNVWAVQYKLKPKYQSEQERDEAILKLSLS